MIIDEIDFSKFPDSAEEAFIELISQANILYDQHSRNEQNYYDGNGNYNGTNEPMRAYVSCIIGFLEEYNLDTDLIDISEATNSTIDEEFALFKARVAKITFRFSLRLNRIGRGTVGTNIYLKSTYKEEIGALLTSIRKIVNQEIDDINKKDKIFTIIATLQSEIDRDQTTVDAVFGRMIELSQVLGEFGHNIEPLINKLERLKKLLWDKTKKVNILPKSEKIKQISHDDNADQSSNFDDEIPF
jgi:hypothetical protein